MPIGSFADTGKIENEVIVLSRALLEIEEVTLNYGADPDNPAFVRREEQRRRDSLYRRPEHRVGGSRRRRLRRRRGGRQEVLRQGVPQEEQGHRLLADRRELQGRHVA